LTTDPDKPRFELPILVDPSTNFPLSYKVTFSDELNSIFSYKKDTREIISEKSTLDSGKKSGLYSILVETTCNKKPLKAVI
jgi:hypothetical protein